MRAFFVLLAVAIGLPVVAQRTLVKKDKRPTAASMAPLKRDFNVRTGEFGQIGSYSGQPAQKTGATKGQVIGNTTYDLQTNGAMPRRLFRASDGTMVATWTMSNDKSGFYQDRGTGYNFFNGLTWNSVPSTRIEDIQSTGWSTPVILPDGSEYVIAHNTDNPDRLHQATRDIAGLGQWSEANLTELDPSVLWPRLAVGGDDGNTLHLIARTESDDDGLNSPVYSGLEGALYYSRSQDGGLSWDAKSLTIGGLDSSNFVGISGDAYAIAARGRYVAVVYAGIMDGVTLYKSEDNGESWDMKVVLPQFIPKFREDVHNTDELFGAGAAVFSADGTCDVIIDESGMAHVFYGVQEISNDEVGDDLIQFNPTANGIDYWNETMEGEYASTVTASFVDPNAFSGVSNETFPIYGFAGMASFPSASLGDDGCIYLAFTAMTETNDLFQFYRHINAVRSCDGGSSWSYPIDLTADQSFRECVFGAAATSTSSNFHLIYQRDFTPGMAVSGDEDAVGPNEIVHTSTPTDDFGGPFICQPTVDGYGALCGDEPLEISISGGDTYSWSTGATTSAITVTLPDDYIVTVTTPCGEVIVDTLPVEQGGNYSVEILVDQAPACDTANGLLSFDIDGPDMDYVYVWSNGSTDSVLTGVGAGFYDIQVIDTSLCFQYDSIVVAEASAPMVSILEVVDESCNDAMNGSITLSAQGEGPLDFDWGDQFPADSVLTGLDGGLYGVLVTDTNDCTSAKLIEVGDGIDFSLYLTATNESCQGSDGKIDLVVITDVDSAFTYAWSNGATMMNVSGLVANTYSVTVEDAKGCAKTGSKTVQSYEELEVAGTVNDQATTGSVLLNITGGVAPFTYQWNNGSNAKNLFTNNKGTYVVIVTGAGGCADTATFTLNGNVSVEELNQFGTLLVYPNPASDYVQFQLPEDVRNAKVQLYDIAGRMVREFTGSLQQTLSIAGMDTGMYELVITAGDKIYSGRLNIVR